MTRAPTGWRAPRHPGHGTCANCGGSIFRERIGGQWYHLDTSVGSVTCMQPAAVTEVVDEDDMATSRWLLEQLERD